MSIDLDAVCLRKPDIEVCESFALFLCSPMLGPDDFARVFVRVAADEENEYVGEHLVGLVAERRYPRVFLAQLVLGSAMCVLYSGRLVDHAPFFPSLDARAVLYRCVESRHGDAEKVWNDLASLPSL